jgi:hypothetical protein
VHVCEKGEAAERASRGASRRVRRNSTPPEVLLEQREMGLELSAHHPVSLFGLHEGPQSHRETA